LLLRLTTWLFLFPIEGTNELEGKLKAFVRRSGFEWGRTWRGGDPDFNQPSSSLHGCLLLLLPFPARHFLILPHCTAFHRAAFPPSERRPGVPLCRPARLQLPSRHTHARAPAQRGGTCPPLHPELYLTLSLPLLSPPILSLSLMRGM
jgi:hypothetical protein